MASWNKGKKMFREDEVFCKNSKVKQTTLRDYYIKAMEYKCTDCGISEWNGKKIGLETHHMNGDRRDNTRENLKLLCPNCHSLTGNFKGKGVRQGFTKVPEESMVDAIKSSSNISEVLIKVDLAPRGGNYTRVYRIMAKHGLSFKSTTARDVSGKCVDCGTPVYYDAKRCRKCLALYYRTAIRPTKEELEKMISEMTWVAIGEKYDVSDNTIKKWARQYGIEFAPRKMA